MDITDTIAQLTAERDRIERAIEALQAIDGSAGSTSQPSGGTRARTRKSVRARKPRRTTAEFLSNETVLKLLTPEGVPAKTIRSRIKATDNQVLRVLKGLESEGKVKRTGERRSTRWHSVGA
jgi:predicted Rossmann fold nucleotide-binding protein DprA/Smf involved in DNA uptake